MLACSAMAHADVDIYTDGFGNGWQYGGWAKQVHSDAAAPVHAGKQSLSAVCAQWEAVSLHHEPLDTKPYTAVAFWINPTMSEQKFQVQSMLDNKPNPAVTFSVPPPVPGQWTRIVVPLTAIGADGKTNFTGFFVQSANAGDTSFAIDDAALVSAPAPRTASGPVTITIDAAAGRHPISPLVYGANFVGPQHAAMNAPLNRLGGNDESRYNWQANAWNLGADWYYESVPRGDATPGKYVDDLVDGSRQARSAPMVTLPLVGWVAKLGPARARLASYSVAKYGPQKDTDAQWFPDAGKGVKTDGSIVTGNDPRDANVPADPAFLRPWLEHLVARWGTAKNGGVPYYVCDNEPNLWHDTHRDVHPQGATMDEVADKIIAAARLVKSVDPSALVVAPEAWDFNGARYSGADLQWAGTHRDWNPAHMPDRTAHGGQDFLPYVLGRIRAEEKKTGTRLIDVASLHYYPQDENNDDVSPAVQERRNRSTRSLWDKNYKAESWYADYINILPRFKAWVEASAPGVKLALTEYNWGADAFMGGATAQADVLGILGREGIDMATRFSAPKPGTPVFNAFRMYRNYNGKNAAFGDTSVAADAPQPDDMAAFAAVRRADGCLTVMVINKGLTGPTSVTLKLAHAMPTGPAQVWQLAGDGGTIARLPDVKAQKGALQTSLPAQSVTLFVVPL